MILIRRKINHQRRLTDEGPANHHICPGWFCFDCQFAVSRLEPYILYFLGFIRFHDQAVFPGFIEIGTDFQQVSAGRKLNA